MMPMTRQEIEVLLDSPDQHDYVVSAYADLTVRNGFERHVDLHLKNESRAAGDALAGAPARRDLEANLAVIREAVRAVADPMARGVAVFSGVARGLRQVVPLEFPVENHLVIDVEPFVLPLLERWYCEPTFLIALVDTDEAHLFEALHGRPDRVRDLKRDDVGQAIQRDKPRFTYKKRFARAQHERLFGVADDGFLKEVVGAVRDHWAAGHFRALILLGQPHITGPLRKLLPRDLGAAVAFEAQHAMTTRTEDLADHVALMIERFQTGREATALAELKDRWAQKHRVAGGPTDVLDALQQGRAERIFLSPRLDLAGARCSGCRYHLGAPVGLCPYCGATTRPVNAVQDIMKLAMRHRVPVQLIHHPGEKDAPLSPFGGVAALLLAEANWAPDRTVAAASEGHAEKSKP
jgi:protein required for attachment to host cells